jgi:DNA-binding MarR family transcriptional regulator
MLASKQLSCQMPATISPPETDAATRLRVTVARMARLLRKTPAGAEAGLSPTRISVLLSVDRRGPLRLSELAEHESLNPTMLSRAISQLVDDGAVQRVSDDRDRRAAWVNVTSEGHQLAERMRRERTQAVNEALAGLTADEARAIERALPALERLSEQLAQERRA